MPENPNAAFHGENVNVSQYGGRPVATGDAFKSAAFSITATGTVVAAVTGKRIKVFAIAYISGGAASFNFRDGATTSLEGAFAHVANSGRVENVQPPAYLFATTAGNSLDVVYSGSGTVAGRISYLEE